MATSAETVFSCRNLHVSVDGKEIVKGVDLTINKGEVHALMGPNGSGKSTMAAALMGHPSYEVSGQAKLKGSELLELQADERARLGLFLGFQYPVAIPGVTVDSFLRTAVSARLGHDVSLKDFYRSFHSVREELGIPKEFATRYLNDGFSGGEKKRLEILQMRMLNPSFALLDETDSGLDIDALKVVSTGVNRAVSEGASVLLVTHYQRMLNYIKPDVVHVFKDGRIARSGGPELALELEERGYDWLNHQQGVAAGR